MKNKNRTKPALKLNKETLRNLTSKELRGVAGGTVKTEGNFVDGNNPCQTEAEHGCRNGGGTVHTII